MPTLSELLRLNSLDAYEEYADSLEYLTDDMLEYNKSVNLTAIRDAEGVYLRHIVDSLTLCPHLDDGVKLIDVGCGGGFPSLPIAIVREDVSVTSLDSTQKKLNFIDRHAKSVGLANITTLCERAEAVGQSDAYREKFDVCVARGVCEMRMLAELCLPLVRVGGKFIAMKNGEVDEELESAKSAIVKLGGKIVEREDVELLSNDSPIKHSLIIIQKATESPKTYPRDWAKIQKKPL